MSRLRICELQINVVEIREGETSVSLLEHQHQTTIYVHTAHSEHTPISDGDSFSLPVHPYIISLAMENLKYMHLARALEAASERAREIFSQNFGDIERVTYRFHIIKKEVEALAFYEGT